MAVDSSLIGLENGDFHFVFMLINVDYHVLWRVSISSALTVANILAAQMFIPIREMTVFWIRSWLSIWPILELTSRRCKRLVMDGSVKL